MNRSGCLFYRNRKIIPFPIAKRHLGEPPANRKLADIVSESPKAGRSDTRSTLPLQRLIRFASFLD